MRENNSDLRADWMRAVDRLSADEVDVLVPLTANSADVVTKYLTENIETISDAGKHFLLTSLRVKQSKSDDLLAEFVHSARSHRT